jgi:hypothetical protein
MRVLICGDRNWEDYELIEAEIRNLLRRLGDDEELTVIHGCARGADSLAGQASKSLKVDHIEEYPALWETYGRGAGPIRNQQMLKEGRPTQVIAFHDDLEHSRGTRDMVRRAERADIPVRVISHAGQ